MLDVFLVAGMVGAFLIIFAWAFEAFESVERHKSLIDLKFAILYMAAMALLLTHSVSINDAVFIFLNATVLVIITFEVLYTIYAHKIKKKASKPGWKR